MKLVIGKEKYNVSFRTTKFILICNNHSREATQLKVQEGRDRQVKRRWVEYTTGREGREESLIKQADRKAAGR